MMFPLKPPFTEEFAAIHVWLAEGMSRYRCFSYKTPIVDILLGVFPASHVWLPVNIAVRNQFMRFTAMNCGNLGNKGNIPVPSQWVSRLWKHAKTNHHHFEAFGDHHSNLGLPDVVRSIINQPHNFPETDGRDDLLSELWKAVPCHVASYKNRALKIQWFVIIFLMNLPYMAIIWGISHVQKHPNEPNYW